jgi:N-acetylmuramoyl-L-alanine amidase
LACGLFFFFGVAYAVPPHSPPSRGSNISIIKLGGIEYVDANTAARKLGLQTAWIEKNRRLALKSDRHRVEIEADSREISVDGLRVYLGNATIIRKGTIYLDRIDIDRCLLPRVRPEASSDTPGALKTIVIDPGHGGIDHGTENTRLKLQEKVFTLDVSLRLKKLLEADGWRVVLTRTDDNDVPKPMRSEIANRERADVFVSVHFNAVANDPKTRGAEVFSFAPQYQRSTDSWGARTDDSEKEPAIGNANDHWNVVLSHALHRELITRLHMDDRGEKIAHWAVLRGLKCPGVLVEPAFISNDAEGRKVATAAFRQQIAEALAAGIARYSTIVAAQRPKG